MIDSQVLIKFCFQVEPFNADTYSFQSHSSTKLDFIEMTSNSSLNDVSLFIGSLLDFNELPLNSELVDALYKREELALVGGLLFEQHSLKIAASCCADFQDWKGVVDDIKRKVSPWMGHDPSPWFEFERDNIIVWSDEDDPENSYSIKLTQREFAEQLQIARQELQGFLKKAKVWALENYNTDPDKLAKGMKRYLLIEY